MDMNPFAELQQYQLGSSLMGQPQASTPAAQPPVPQLPMGGMPPAAPAQADPAGMEQRTAGWMSALGELQANPAVAIALLQMGTALTGGKKFGTALGMGMGAMGRAGEIENAYAKQGLAEEMLRRKADLEERRFGLDEREMAAREAVWGAQAQRYGRMGAGGGGGGGGAGAKIGQLKTATVKVGNQSVPVFYGVAADASGKPIVSVYDITGTPITDPQAIKDIMTQVGTSGGEDGAWAREWAGKYGLPGEGTSYDLTEAQARAALSGQGRRVPAGGASVGTMDPKAEAEARMRALREGGFGQGPRGVAPGVATPTQARAPNPALGSIVPELEKRNVGPRQVLDAARDGTMDTWAKQGWDVKSAIEWALNANVLGAKDALDLRKYLEKY